MAQVALSLPETQIQHEDSERALWAILSLIGRPDGLLDVGARDGWLVRTAFSAGIRPALGLEANPELCALSTTKLLCRDVDRPFNIQGRFDLVTCLWSFPTSKNPEALAQNLIRHTSKYLICGQGWPSLLTQSRRVSLDEDLTERMESSLRRSLGVFRCAY